MKVLQMAKFPRGELKHLASVSGVQVTYLYQIISGVRRPSIDVAIRISHATEGRISVEELMRPEVPWPLMARLFACDPPAGELALERWLNREEAAERAAPPPEQGAPATG